MPHIKKGTWKVRWNSEIKMYEKYWDPRPLRVYTKEELQRRLEEHKNKKE